MSDDPAQPTISAEPAQTPAESQSSASVVAPEPTPAPTEPIPASMTESTPTNMPPEAQNGPETPSTPVPAEIPVSAPLPQNQPPTQVVEERSLAYPPTAASGRPEDSPQRTDPRSHLAKALEKIQFRKRAKLEKIMKFAQGRKEVTNDQVEKLLHISDSTAQRYLIQLAEEGKLKRIGKDGSSLYEPLNGSLPTI